MVNQKFGRKFVAFILDDRYLDNFTQALPVFEKYQAPFTVYVCTGFPEGKVILWWEILEQIVRCYDHITVKIDGQIHEYKTDKTREKYQAFSIFYWMLRKFPHEKQYAEIESIIDQFSFDWQGLCRSCSMNWDQIRDFNQHPLVNIGAHSINHF